MILSSQNSIFNLGDQLHDQINQMILPIQYRNITHFNIFWRLFPANMSPFHLRGEMQARHIAKAKQQAMSSKYLGWKLILRQPCIDSLLGIPRSVHEFHKGGLKKWEYLLCRCAWVIMCTMYTRVYGYVYAYVYVDVGAYKRVYIKWIHMCLLVLRLG